MKTLDEVLKSYELSCGKKDCAQCPYNDECLDHFTCECYERMNDTHHYLKEYRAKRKKLEDEIARYQEAVRNCEEAENKYRMLKGELEGFPSNMRMNIRW